MMASIFAVQMLMSERACAKWFVAIAVLILACWPFASHAADNTLGGLREDVREEHSGDSGSPTGSSRGGNSDNKKNRGNSCDDSSWGQLVLYTVAAPFWAPHALLEDDFDDLGYFLAYPYNGGAPGNLIYENTPGSGANVWSGQLLIDDSYNFDQINRVHSQLRIDTTTRFGVDAESTWLHEQLAGHASDELWIGNAALTFRFAQSRRAQFRTGLGLRWLTDEQSTDLGFSFLYGADFFPAGPWVISSVFDTGTLGSAGVLHARLTGGVQFHRFELFGGYDYLRIGHADIAGPVAGVRLWF